MPIINSINFIKKEPSTISEDYYKIFECTKNQDINIELKKDINKYEFRIEDETIISFNTESLIISMLNSGKSSFKAIDLDTNSIELAYYFLVDLYFEDSLQEQISYTVSDLNQGTYSLYPDYPYKGFKEAIISVNIDQSQFDAIREEGYNAGRQDGYDEAFNQYYDSRYEEGYNAGLADASTGTTADFITEFDTENNALTIKAVEN